MFTWTQESYEKYQPGAFRELEQGFGGYKK